MTKKEKKEILIKMISLAIAKNDVELIQQLFAKLCYLDNYNYNYLRLIGALMPDEEYKRLVVDCMEGKGDFKEL